MPDLTKPDEPVTPAPWPDYLNEEPVPDWDQPENTESVQTDPEPPVENPEAVPDRAAAPIAAAAPDWYAIPDGEAVPEEPAAPDGDAVPEEAAAPEGEAVPDTTAVPEDDAPPTEAEKLAKKAKRAEKSVKEYQFGVLRVLLLLLVLWVLFFKFIGLMRMPSDEMFPRIDAGDMVLYYRLDTDVRAQDVIVVSKVEPGGDTPKLYVLRVVAAGGDTVEISDSDRLIINGSTMVESNIFYPTPRYEGFTTYPLTLGEDECFVLADSRSGGSDSRYFGPVQKDEILGTVITILRRNNL